MLWEFVGNELGGLAYRAHSISSPLIIIRDQLIKACIYHLLHTVCCSEARALRLGWWEHIILRISDSFEHVNVRYVGIGTMPGSEADGEHLDQQEMIKMLRSLVLRQGQLEERMASDRARGEGQYSPSREQDGVRTGGNSPVPGVVESSGVNVGPREFSSIKQLSLIHI